MSTSYSGDPAASTTDWIRVEIQDTGPIYSGDPFVFQNEEIASKLADFGGNKWQASGHLLLVWARQIGHNPNFQIGRFSEDWNAAAKFLEEKGKELLASSQATGGGGAYVGGISVADKAAKAADSDRTQGAFTRTSFDNPEAGW
jgi:hypothetical protein